MSHNFNDLAQYIFIDLSTNTWAPVEKRAKFQNIFICGPSLGDFINFFNIFI